MKRLTAIVVSAGLALAAGSAVFHTSMETKRLQGELARIERQIDRERALIDVLVAEWAYVNQPDRLRTLADAYLPIGPVAGDRIITASSAVPPVLPLAEGQTHPLALRFPPPPRRPGSGPPPVAPVDRAPIPTPGLAQTRLASAIAPGGQTTEPAPAWRPPLPDRRPAATVRPAGLLAARAQPPAVSARPTLAAGTAPGPAEDPIGMLLATFRTGVGGSQ